MAETKIRATLLCPGGHRPVSHTAAAFLLRVADLLISLSSINAKGKNDAKLNYDLTQCYSIRHANGRHAVAPTAAANRPLSLGLLVASIVRTIKCTMKRQEIRLHPIQMKPN